MLLVRGGRKLTYPNLTNTCVRPICRAAGITATLHMLRHEYVYGRLREIEAMNVPERDRRADLEGLARELGWTSTAMFRVYDAYERERRSVAQQTRFWNSLEQGVAAPQQLTRDPDRRPVVAPLPGTQSRGPEPFLRRRATRGVIPGVAGCTPSRSPGTNLTTSENEMIMISLAGAPIRSSPQIPLDLLGLDFAAAQSATAGCGTAPGRHTARPLQLSPCKVSR